MKRVAIHLLIIILMGVGLLVGAHLWLGLYTQHNNSITIPPIQGITLAEAASQLHELGLDYEVIDSIYSPSQAPGSVIDAIPSTGAKVKQGRKLFIITSTTTSRSEPIPRVIDVSLRQATTNLNALGFQDITVKYITGRYKDLVLAILGNGKTLDMGEMMPITTPLSIIVSDGLEGQIIPDSLEIATPEQTVQ